MRRRLNLHSNFFSSLKQVEKRLKLENDDNNNNNLLQQEPQPSEIHSSPTQSLSSPMHLYTTRSSNLGDKSSNLEDSEIPVEFLSNSLDFPPTHEQQLPEKPLLKTSETLLEEEEEEKEENFDVDEIGLLIELLGLSDLEGNDSDLDLETCASCHCDGGFFGKIVGMKGPKCKKEMERLEGWISYFRSEKIEPLRLAHLLLGKAAFLCGNGDPGGFEVLEFPSTVEEFLRLDPPTAYGIDSIDLR